MRSCIEGNSTDDHAKPHHCLPTSRVVSEKVDQEWQDDLPATLMDISIAVNVEGSHANICDYTRRGDRCNACEGRMTEEICPKDTV